MLVCLDTWSLRYCSANIGVVFTSLTVPVTICPIFVILILYDLPLWSLSPWSVTMPCVQGLLFPLWTPTIDPMGINVCFSILSWFLEALPCLLNFSRIFLSVLNNIVATFGSSGPIGVDLIHKELGLCLY